MFLTVADTYARNNNKRAYCHVVGLGLGSWGLKPCLTEQAEIIILSYYETLSESSFPNISDIYFAWFPDSVIDVCGAQDGQQLVTSKNRVTVWFGKRNPSDPVGDPTKLLVAQYAW
jgi:hypothetical protein